MTKSIDDYRDVEPLLESSEKPDARTSNFRELLTRTKWLITIITFACLLSALGALYGYHLGRGSLIEGTYEDGFITEFRPAESVIKLEKRRFTGSIRFDESGSEYPYPGDSDVYYVGQPEEAIDTAWKNMLQGHHMYVTDDEEKRFEMAEEFYKEDGKGYKIGLSMFHALHCLNVIRMYIDRDYYNNMFDHAGMLKSRTHVDHCIDFLRQSLQCYGDLTPVPVRWWDSANRAYSDTGLSHTCRNFDDIKAWVNERHNGSLAIAIDDENTI